MKILIIVFLFSLSAIASESIIETSASCEMKIVHDKASVILGVSSLQSDPKKASQNVYERYNELKQAIVKMKLKGKVVRTAYNRLSKKSEWNGRKKEFKGHEASMGLYIETTQVKKMSDVLALATKFKVDEIGSIRGILSKNLFENSYNGCLKEATVKAKSKAVILAESLGRKLGDLMYVSDTAKSDFSPRSGMRGGVMKAMSAESAPEITESYQNIVVEVFVKYGIR